MQRVNGTVVLWRDEEGWGALRTEAAPSDVFAHFSNLVGEGYLDLRVGQRVQFLLEPFPTGQDGYFYRAEEVGIIE
jgi:CspA family cold shock protein